MFADIILGSAFLLTLIWGMDQRAQAQQLQRQVRQLEALQLPTVTHVDFEPPKISAADKARFLATNEHFDKSH